MQETGQETQSVLSVINGAIKGVLDFGFSVGAQENQSRVTIATVLMILLAFFIVSQLFKYLKVFLSRKLPEPDKDKFMSIFTFLRYFAYVLVVVTVLSASGVNVTVFLTASAALFVGLGFALQTLFQDLLSGIFMILDKTILVGDIISFDDDKMGRVFDIRLRSTRVVTRDDKVIIIPNHKFLVENVNNWTQNNKTVRLKVTLSVAYGSDTKKVEQLLLSTVKGQPNVLNSPQPFVLFENFGDFGLQFSLYFYTDNGFDYAKIQSAVRFEIDNCFRESKIKIPYPQHEIYLHKNS